MSTLSKVFWEGHKILQNLHQLFDWKYIWQINGGDFAKFVAFSEYLNFKILPTIDGIGYR